MPRPLVVGLSLPSAAVPCLVMASHVLAWPIRADAWACLDLSG